MIKVIMCLFLGFGIGLLVAPDKPTEVESAELQEEYDNLLDDYIEQINEVGNFLIEYKSLRKHFPTWEGCFD